MSKFNVHLFYLQPILIAVVCGHTLLCLQRPHTVLEYWQGTPWMPLQLPYTGARLTTQVPEVLTVMGELRAAVAACCVLVRCTIQSIHNNSLLNLGERLEASTRATTSLACVLAILQLNGCQQRQRSYKTLSRNPVSYLHRRYDTARNDMYWDLWWNHHYSITRIPQSAPTWFWLLNVLKTLKELQLSTPKQPGSWQS